MSIDGALVFFRHPAMGWVLGNIVSYAAADRDGQLVVCAERESGSRATVPETEVAVAREDSLEERDCDLSSLSALHPATIVRALRLRYDGGSPFAAIGRDILLYLHPRWNPHLANTVLSNAAMSVSTLPSAWGPWSLRTPTYLHNEHEDREPLGWWTTAKEAFTDAMQSRHAAVISLGESECGAWLQRLWAHRRRAELERQYFADVNLGRAETHRVPPAEDMMDDALAMGTNGYWVVASPSQHIELFLCRLGMGAWQRRYFPSPGVRRLTALLADMQTVLDIFLGGGGGRRDPESASPPAAPAYSHCTQLRYNGDGILVGWKVDVYWTMRGPLRRPPHAFRLLANSSVKTSYLGHHTDPDWFSQVPAVSSGEAFADLQGILARLGFSQLQLKAIWGVVAAVMLMVHRFRFEEVQGAAELFTDSVDQVAYLLGTTTDKLRASLLTSNGRRISRPIAEARRDSLADSLYEGVVQLIVSKGNALAGGDAGDVHTVNVVGVPGLSYPSHKESGVLGDLIHNLAVDAMWCLYDTSVFNQNLDDCRMQGCPVNPLLHQLQNRPTIDKLNPLLQTLGRLDGYGVVHQSGHTDSPLLRKEACHYTGEYLTYDLQAVPPPPLDQLYDGYVDRELGDIVRTLVLPHATKVSMAAAGIGGISDLLDHAKCDAHHWVVTFDPCDTTPSISMHSLSVASQHTKATPFSGLHVESAVYSSRVIETCLLNKVGHPVWLPLPLFASRYKAVIFPRYHVTPTHTAQAIVASAFGPNPWTWSDDKEGTIACHVGPSRVLMTREGYDHLEGLRASGLDRLAVLVQQFARACLPRNVLRTRYYATLIQAAVRAHRSTRLVAAKTIRQSLNMIAKEVLWAAHRRRRWMSDMGYDRRRITYRNARHLEELRQQELAAASGMLLQDHWQFGLQCLRDLTAVFHKEWRDGVAAVLQRRLDELCADEEALRIYLTACEEKERSGIACGTLGPAHLLCEHQRGRAVIAGCEVDERIAIIFNHSLYFRDRLELVEFIEWIHLVQEGLWMLRIEEERSHRKNVAHSESRCRDLIMKEFAVTLIQLGGDHVLRSPRRHRRGGSPSWKVELEGPARTAIMKSEADDRRKLRNSFVEGCLRGLVADEERGRWAVEEMEYVTMTRLLQGTRGLELAAASCLARVAVDEQRERYHLQRLWVMASERRQRHSLLRECEETYNHTLTLHAIMMHEWAGRKAIVHCWVEWVRAWPPSAILRIPPVEAVSRSFIMRCECVTRLFFSQAAEIARCEVIDRRRIADTMHGEISLVKQLQDEVRSVVQQRSAVEARLNRRPSSMSTRSFRPSDFLASPDVISSIHTARAHPPTRPESRSGTAMWTSPQSLSESLVPCTVDDGTASLTANSIPYDPAPSVSSDATVHDSVDTSSLPVVEDASDTSPIQPAPPPPPPAVRHPTVPKSKEPKGPLWSVRPPTPSSDLASTAATLDASLVHLRYLKGQGGAMPPRPPPNTTTETAEPASRTSSRCSKVDKMEEQLSRLDGVLAMLAAEAAEDRQAVEDLKSDFTATRTDPRPVRHPLTSFGYGSVYNS